MTHGDHVSTKAKVEKTENNAAVVTIIPTMHDFNVLATCYEVGECR